MNHKVNTVRVPLSDRGYDVEIGTGNLERAGAFLAERIKTTHAVVITDENVADPHADLVADSLSEFVERIDIFVVEPGESCKCIDVAEPLWENLLEVSTDRKSVIVAVGGGVIGDLAGFVAATYARGLPLMQIPTTLLAQVDSSVGGKVGINLPDSKNMVGAFWQPLGVLIDTDVLETLPDREYVSGLAEVVKYGVILDAEFFAFLENNVDGLKLRQPDVLARIIERSCQLKADVVQADEREVTGHRAILNYGHTFGHALESVTKYSELLHGEAVAIGMICAARLSESLDRVGPQFTARLQQLLIELELPVEVPSTDYDALLASMSHDKKTEHGRLRFVLPSQIGHVELVQDVDPELARKALAD